jgi:hypothetical protein
MREKIDFRIVVSSILLVAGFGATRISAQASLMPAGPPGGVNASKLPDTQGIHLGMTVDQASAAMKSVFPGTAPQVKYSHYGREPAWVSSMSGANQEQHDFLQIFFSMPPNPQQVVFVQRTLILVPGKQPTAESTVASLRQKYGKELPLARNSAEMMAWAYDEQGQPASPKGPANWSPTDCAQQKLGVTGGLPDPASSLQVPPFPDPLPLAQKVSTMTADLCNHHVYVTAQLMLGNIQGTSVVAQISMYLGEKPLMVRDYLAGQQYLQGVIDAKSQQQMKNAQQQKAPTL